MAYSLLFQGRPVFEYVSNVQRYTINTFQLIQRILSLEQQRNLTKTIHGCNGRIDKAVSWASPERQGSPLQRCAFVLMLLAVVGGLEAARVQVRVSLPSQLAVDIQETV